MFLKLILVALGVVGSIAAQTYTQPFTSVTRVTMLGTTHGQGVTIAPGECWDASSPQNKIVQLAGYPRRFSNGNVLWAWAGAKTGNCYAVGPAGGAGGGAIWGAITGVLAGQTDLQNALNLKAPLVGGVVPTVNLGSGTASATTFLRGDNTWAVPAGGGGGGGTWGTITGTLTDQTDLQSALDLKAPLASPVFTGTPTISSFLLANHSHVDGPTGGQLDASSIFNAGIVPSARLGNGTADTTTFLRGDLTWQVPPGAGGGATTLPQLTDVDDTALPTNRNFVVGDGVIFQARPPEAADILSGTFPAERLAAGTPTAGFVPVSTGPGAAPSWGSVTGTGTVTSVATGCGVSGGPITTTGTITARVSPVSTLTGPYTFVTGDCGRLLSFGAAAAVTLPTIDGVNFYAGWYVHVQNRAASGNVVITPTTNLIDAASPLTLLPGQGVMIAATGTHYWTQRGMAPPAAGGGTYAGGVDGCITINTTPDPDELEFDIDCLLTESYPWTGTHNFTGGVLIIPNGTTLPALCTPGQLAMDTDATSGQRVSYCDSTNTWLPLGGGGGGMADPGGNGFMVRTALNVSAARTLTVAGGLAITNATGVSANPLISGPTAQANSFFSNWQFGGIGVTTAALAPSNEGKGTRITATRNMTIATCQASMVTTAVIGSEIRIGIYNPDETMVCAGTYTIAAGGSQTASVACSASLVMGQDYYLIIASTDATNSLDSFSLSTGGARALGGALPANIKPAVNIVGATFDATEAMTKITATTNVPVIVCY